MSASQDELLQESERLAVLKDLAEALNEATDVSEAMDAILPRLSGVLGLSTAWAFRYDAQRGSFVEVGASGLPPALSENDAACLKTGWCDCQDQFIEGRLHNAVNIVRCSRLRDAVGDKAGLAYHASIPLRSKGKPLGILNVAAAGHSVFTKPALQLLGTIGHHVAVAVDRAGILADERLRANKLRALSEMSAEMVSFVQTTAILQFAAREFVERLGYECCGITVRDFTGRGDEPSALVAAAHRISDEHPSEYSYMQDEDVPLLADGERLLLPQARSALVRRIPHSEYDVRLESCRPNAFRGIDEDILSAFAWHVAAALENARLYQQSLNDAKWVERRQLAADLHDAVSQRLFSALLLARTVRTLAARSGQVGELQSAVAKIEALIAESQQEMRGLIETLRPADDRGIVARIREKIAPLQLQGQTRIHLAVEGQLDVPLSFEQREALLKVVDEALQNALKHANARNIYVHVTHTGERFVVSVQDDGRGFEESLLKEGLGTSTMYERMQRYGGQLRIKSARGKGTRVTAEFPLGSTSSISDQGRAEGNKP